MKDLSDKMESEIIRCARSILPINQNKLGTYSNIQVGYKAVAHDLRLSS